jgi:hypothetical protein
VATIISSNNYKYTSKGPLDAKCLVKTYDDLLDIATWTYVNPDTGKESFIAYNGMIVAVWLNNTDPSKNGIYFLHDPSVTKITGKPNIADSTCWHKMGGLNGLPGLESQIAALKSRLDTAESNISTLQQTTSALNTAVETLRSDVTSLQTQVPVIEVIHGGTSQVD